MDKRNLGDTGEKKTLENKQGNMERTKQYTQSKKTIKLKRLEKQKRKPPERQTQLK